MEHLSWIISAFVVREYQLKKIICYVKRKHLYRSQLWRCVTNKIQIIGNPLTHHYFLSVQFCMQQYLLKSNINWPSKKSQSIVNLSKQINIESQLPHYHFFFKIKYWITMNGGHFQIHRQSLIKIYLGTC